MKEDLDKIIELATKMKKELEETAGEDVKTFKLEIKEENGRRYFEHHGIRYDEFKPNEFVSKTILSEEIIDDIVEDKRYLDSDKDVRYNNDIFDSSWENSFIRKILNSTFKEKYLKDLDIECEVRCLTKEEAENLPDDLKVTERYGYWTMSPYNFNSGWAYVFIVNSNGFLSYSYVNYTRGVRPVIELKDAE